MAPNHAYSFLVKSPTVRELLTSSISFAKELNDGLRQSFKSSLALAGAVQGDPHAKVHLWRILLVELLVNL